MQLCKSIIKFEKQIIGIFWIMTILNDFENIILNPT